MLPIFMISMSSALLAVVVVPGYLAEVPLESTNIPMVIADKATTETVSIRRKEMAALYTP
jgi:hypothetical protein